MTLLEHLSNSAGADYQRPFNFGPEPGRNHTVLDLVKSMTSYFEFDFQIESDEQFHEAKTLSLDISDAKVLLSWNPLLDFESTTELTGRWYADYIPGNGLKITTKQLEEILSRAN